MEKVTHPARVLGKPAPGLLPRKGPPPGFPVRLGEINQLHAAFLIESRTRCHGRGRAVGNPGPSPRSDGAREVHDRVENYKPRSQKRDLGQAVRSNALHNHTVVTLVQDCVSYPQPVRRVVQVRVPDDNLAKQESGNAKEVDRVNAPVDDQIARYSKKNQNVHADKRPLKWQYLRRETPKGR